jgi:hypothetical protein
VHNFLDVALLTENKVGRTVTNKEEQSRDSHTNPKENNAGRNEGKASNCSKNETCNSGRLRKQKGEDP